MAMMRAYPTGVFPAESGRSMMFLATILKPSKGHWPSHGTLDRASPAGHRPADSFDFAATGVNSLDSLLTVFLSRIGASRCKRCSFLKKEPKNPWTLAHVARRAYTPTNKSLLLLFFRKEDLSLILKQGAGLFQRLSR
jgi:hypothetical protein